MIYPIYTEENKLNNLINAYCHTIEFNKTLEKRGYHVTPKILQNNTTLYDETIIDYVNQLIGNAIKQLVSDIHIESFEKLCRVRYRCDGLLHEITTFPHEFALRIITRLKIMAKLDITEHRFPQDSRFQYHSIDIRINTCPVLYGEKIVLRILNHQNYNLNIDSLGLSEKQKNIFIENISRPHGMIIITGPTSSGKTLTLYSALNYLNQIEKNITTLEDPVEIQLNGISQISVQPKINLNFATLLRAILRQDPDIIMLGEIRDKETATIAIQAATTGHLVLSSLHTNSAAATIPRLISLGISPLEITSSISLIVAQRLIRKLCLHCKKNRLDHCQHCLEGYHGRTGIFELLPISEKIKKSILSENNTSIPKIMEEECCTFLHQAAYEKVAAGITNIAEINRVLIT